MRTLLALAASTLLAATPGALRVTATIKTPAQPIGVAFGAGSAWTASFGFNGVVRIDPRTNKVVATIAVGNAPSEIAAGGGRVWATVQPTQP